MSFAVLFIEEILQLGGKKNLKRVGEGSHRLLKQSNVFKREVQYQGTKDYVLQVDA